MARSVMLLLLLLVAAAMTNTNPGVAFAGEPTNRHLPPLLDCTPPAPSTHNDSSFRANLASTLAALPSIVAASSKGLATLESADAGSGRAFARGGCFGLPGDSSWAGACVACLKAASRDLAGGACRGSRRAGAWRDGCFMAYADTDASSGREDAFHGWFYAGSNAPLVLAERGECMVDAAAYCKRCIDDSLRGAPPLGWLWRLRGGEVVVVSYTCFLSIKISPNSKILTMDKFWSWYMIAAEVLIIGMLFCLIMETLIRVLA